MYILLFTRVHEFWGKAHILIAFSWLYLQIQRRSNELRLNHHAVLDSSSLSPGKFHESLDGREMPLLSFPAWSPLVYHKHVFAWTKIFFKKIILSRKIFPDSLSRRLYLMYPLYHSRIAIKEAIKMFSYFLKSIFRICYTPFHFLCFISKRNKTLKPWNIGNQLFLCTFNSQGISRAA